MSNGREDKTSPPSTHPDQHHNLSAADTPDLNLFIYYRPSPFITVYSYILNMAPHAKPQNSVRRVSSLSKVSTPPSSARASKSSKAAKLVCLKLSSNHLARFPHETSNQPPPPPSSSTKKPAAPAVTTATTKEETRPAEPKLEVVSPPPPTTTSSDTPQPSIHESALKPATKQSNPKTGTKRGLGAGVSDPKPRARPGPKKKLKL